MIDWTKEELQEIVFMTRSWGRFAKFLRLSAKEAKAMKEQYSLLTTTEYVRGLNLGDVAQGVMCRGSFERVAASWGVSTSFLKSVLKEGYSKVRNCDADCSGCVREQAAPSGTVKQAMERYLSVRLASRMMIRSWGDEWTESKVRTTAREEGFDLSKCIDGHDTDYNNSFGRRAERLYAEKRGDGIVRDCNKEKGPTADFDFLDSVHGRVNVKASRAFRRKQANDRKRYWKFSTAGLDKADTVALMFYDSVGKSLLYWAVVPAGPLASKSTVIIEDDLDSRLAWGMDEHV